MAHMSPKMFALLEVEFAVELKAIRALAGITERKLGVFYRRSSPFLHFHEKAGRRFAHLKMATDWQEVDLPPAPTKVDRAKFLAAVKLALVPILGRK